MTAQLMTQRQLSLKVISRDDAFSVFDDELKNRVFQDYVDLSSNPLPVDCMYIGCFVNGIAAGCFFVKKTTKHTVEVHINMLKKYRGYSLFFAKNLKKTLFENKDIMRIETQIPVYYKNMVKFVQSLGFVIEGERRSSFLKNGVFHNTFIIGLIR